MKKGVKNTVKKQVKNAFSVREFLKLGGKNKDISIMRVNSRKYTRDAEELHLMERYYTLLVNTDYLEEELYKTLVEEKSYEEASEETNVKIGYLKNIVHEGIRKIYEDLTGDPFALVRYREDFNQEIGEEVRILEVQRLTELIELTIEDYTMIKMDGIDDMMVYDFGDYAEDYREFNGEINEELFNETIDRMKYISKPYLDILYNQMDKRTLGYVKYLLLTREERLSRRDQENKKLIKDIWFLP